MTIRNLSIDLETYSSTDLSESGVYRYVEAPDFKILLLAYSINGGNVHVIDLANGESIPTDISAAILDPTILKWAFNAQFERICLSRWLGLPTGRYLDPDSWRCSMIWSAYLGLPLSLAGAGSVLGLEKQKLIEGRDLIRYFCKPCSPTALNIGRTKNQPNDAPDKWALFRDYNRRDVEAELAIKAKLARFPVPDSIWAEYKLDQEINDRGVALEMRLVRQAIDCDQKSRAELIKQIQALTEMQNPNSVAQMKHWLSENGLETDSLGKKAVSDLLRTAPEPLCAVLSLRQKLAKTSIKKYQAMANAVCADGRAHGMFQFYGANRTGRYSGRLIQLQNLPQNHMPDLAEARSLLRVGNYQALSVLYDSIPDVLSELIRTAFVPRLGCRFIVADFAAIEARVIAWLAKETWRQEVFTAGGDIYCASASQMFRVPVEKHGINGHLRQKGKVAELAIGFGGSVGALKAMGALEMGLTEEELQPLVSSWRSANPNIVRLWWDVDRAAVNAVRQRTTTNTHGIQFSYQSGMLFITLPSGRRLSYVKPRIGENQFGSECVTYEGAGSTKKWERLESYGPKFVENIVQGISRDILCYAMQSLQDLPIVMHVHDEIVIEADQSISVESICQRMSQTPPWAEGLLLRADGYETEFYRKD